MSHRILVIDDEETVRKSFPLALEDTDFDVELAENGEEGVEKVKNNKYDLIYLDLKMPGLNGVETFREIRKKDQDVNVYFITAFHKEFFEELKVLQTEKQTFEIMKKPLDMEQITTLTKSILGA